MLTNFLLDVAGNLDCNSVCYVITRREDKEQEWKEDTKEQRDEKEEKDE